MDNIKNNNYDEGFVIAIDILGFSQLTYIESNFSSIKSAYEKLVSITNTYNMNSFPGKFCYGSDSILMTYSKDFANSIGTLLDSAISWITLFRYIVNKELYLDIRAVITYGKYIHTGEMNSIFFGPAITRAFKLAEQKSSFSDFPSPYKEINPASIIFDNVLQNHKDIEAIRGTNFDTSLFCHLGNGYYALNPFEYTKKEQLNTLKMTMEQYLAFQNDIFDKNNKKAEKYFFYKDLISTYNH